MATTPNDEKPPRNLENFPPIESFQTIPSVILRDLRRKTNEGAKALEHVDIAVYALLKSHARVKGCCHPAHERLAALAGCSTSTVKRSLKRLEAARHICRKGHSTGQILLLTDVSQGGKVIRRSKPSVAIQWCESPTENAPPETSNEFEQAHISRASMEEDLDYLFSFEEKQELERRQAMGWSEPPPNDEDVPF